MNYIYSLSDPDTGQIRYVGKTRDLRDRIYRHIRSMKGCKKSAWIKELVAAGKRPMMEILEECGDQWQECEQFWITYLRFLGFPLLNMKQGGGGERPGGTGMLIRIDGRCAGGELILIRVSRHNERKFLSEGKIQAASTIGKRIALVLEALL